MSFIAFGDKQVRTFENTFYYNREETTKYYHYKNGLQSSLITVFKMTLCCNEKCLP